MKVLLNRFFPVAITGILATLFFASSAIAGCGAGPGFHQIAPPDLDAMTPQTPSIGPGGGAASIVGMWKVVFTSKGTSTVPGPTLPPDTPFEWGYAHWHIDNTEFFNSGDRQPTSQNFCMGVWEQTEPSHYKLNHFAYNYDPVTSVLIGKVNIREEVKVDDSGNKFKGKFTITGWDASGNQIISIAGTLQAVRVTVDTVDSSIP
jgi:hypothetical protein